MSWALLAIGVLATAAGALALIVRWALYLPLRETKRRLRCAEMQLEIANAEALLAHAHSKRAEAELRTWRTEQLRMKPEMRHPNANRHEAKARVEGIEENTMLNGTGLGIKLDWKHGYAKIPVPEAYGKQFALGDLVLVSFEPLPHAYRQHEADTP